MTKKSLISSSTRTGYEGKKAFSYRTLGLSLGEPGPRSITVLLDGQSRTIPVVFDPAGQLDISGLCDDQAIFGRKEFLVEWLGSYVARESIRATVNGKEVPVEVTGKDDTLHLLEGRLGPVAGIDPGKNTIVIEGVDVRGIRRKRRVSFRYYPENTVAVGDAFVLPLGAQEPAGGPFFDVKIEGTSLVKRQDLTARPGPVRFGGQTTLSSEKTVLSRFEAVSAGESIIRTSEKQSRTDLPRERSSVRVLVQTPEETAKIAKIQAGGFALKRVRAAGLFTCLVPEGWPIVRNPDGDRKIYGLSTYRLDQGETGGAGLKLVVQFYPRENDAGLRSGDDFITALLNERPGGGDESQGPIYDSEVAARHAKRVERSVYLATKTRLFFTRRLPIVEEYVVVPDERGFYVLMSRAPLEGIQEARSLFNSLVDSFEPLK